MHELIKNLQSAINDPSGDETEIIQRLKNMILENEMISCKTKESKSLSELFSANISALNESQYSDLVYKSGFKNLDDLIGGFSLGEFSVIGSRPSMGKTQLCVNLVLHLSQSHPVLYFTFDLSEYLLLSRFLSALTGIESRKIIQHELSDAQKDKIRSASVRFQGNRVFINDSCSSSVSAFKAQCIRQIQENGIKVIIVDYLQMMSSARYRNNRELEISYISRELKSLARDYNVCVIATSSLSRSPEKRSAAAKPILSDLRDSGAIEQDADKVFFIYRPEYYAIDVDEDGNSTTGLTELIIAKNRNGRLGSAMLKRNAVFSSFSDFVEYTNEFSFSPERIDEIDKKPF